MLRAFLLYASSLAILFFILLVGRPAFAHGADSEVQRKPFQHGSVARTTTRWIFRNTPI